MLNSYKEDKENRTLDVKAVRDGLLRFIKEQLQKLEGGEGNSVRSIHLFLSPPAEEKYIYESAVYFEDGDRFKHEVQKIADDYAIDLPENWELETSFDASVPAEAIKVPRLDAAVFIQTRKRRLHKTATACLRILNGEAEKEEYNISSTSGIVNIGRERQVQTEDGFFRINHIAFPGNSQHESNRYVSRQHAHVEWDEENGVFLLFADEGGVPPKNKIKVKPLRGNVVKLQSTAIGYPLEEGDQIVLGETALLEFRYSKKDNA